MAGQEKKQGLKDSGPKFKLDSSDALRIASKDDRFASALLEDPRAFAPVFDFTDREIDAIRTIPDVADLTTMFEYDA